MREKISLDLDDTLVPFAKNWLKWIYKEKISNHLYSLEDVKNYSWFYDVFGEKANDYFTSDPKQCYENMNPFPGSQIFYLFCIENFDVDIVTHADHKKSEIAKKEFIKKWFGKNCKIKFVKKLQDKYEQTKNSILIDDYPLHIINHITYNKKPAILFNNKNRNGWGHIEDYKPLIEDLKPNMDLFYYATDYVECINILEKIKRK